MSEQQALEKPTFPFGVRPDVPVDDGTEDDRGPDTINRLLLHGARYHDRESLFIRWEQGRKGWSWTSHPDWRADRNAIRAALVLRQRIGMEASERAALWIPGQQIQAQIVPIWRYVRHQLPRRHRIFLLLGDQNVNCSAGKREHAGYRSIEHHS